MFLSDEPIPQELGVKAGRGGKLFKTIPTNKLLEMENDDDIIDYFLENQ